MARICEKDRHMALLVREDWLIRILRETGHSVVFGWVGDKQLVEAGIFSGLVGDYTRIDAVASLVENKWMFGDRRVERRSVNR